MATLINSINSGAIVPDQLLAYVGAVSGLKSAACGECVLHHREGAGVLIGYPHSDPLDKNSLNKAVEQAMAFPGLDTLTVLSAIPPELAPETAEIKTDHYWILPLPFQNSNAKLRNMLKRGQSQLVVCKEKWSTEHESLAKGFCQRKNLDDATSYIHAHLGDYLNAAPEAILFCCRDGSGNLQACAIGDFTSLATAFYMFAFRAPGAPPGSADILLDVIVGEAMSRGHTRVNLGLGIGPGVEFFKKKWGARRWLPCIETSWRIKKKSWFSRLFGGGK